MLGTGNPEQDVVVGGELLLEFDLAGNEVGVGELEMVNADKWQLLFDVMAKPLSADGVLPDEGDFRSKKQATIEQWLKDQALGQSE